MMQGTRNQWKAAPAMGPFKKTNS